MKGEAKLTHDERRQAGELDELTPRRRRLRGTCRGDEEFTKWRLKNGTWLEEKLPVRTNTIGDKLNTLTG